jgi:hypothetical protein
VCILVNPKKRKQRNKETKKQRNKETKKTKKQRNKESFDPLAFFLGTAASLLFVTPGAPKQNKKQKLLFIVSFQTDRKKRFSFRETLKRARPKTIATKKRG